MSVYLSRLVESAKLEPEGRVSAWEPLCSSGAAGVGSSRLTGVSPEAEPVSSTPAPPPAPSGTWQQEIVATMPRRVLLTWVM